MVKVVPMFDRQPTVDEVLERCKGRFHNVIVIGVNKNEGLLDYETSLEDIGEIYFQVMQTAHAIMNDYTSEED